MVTLPVVQVGSLFLPGTRKPGVLLRGSNSPFRVSPVGMGKKGGFLAQVASPENKSSHTPSKALPTAIRPRRSSMLQTIQGSPSRPTPASGWSVGPKKKVALVTIQAQTGLASSAQPRVGPANDQFRNGLASVQPRRPKGPMIILRAGSNIGAPASGPTPRRWRLSPGRKE
jgi:hypothetical protein